MLAGERDRLNEDSVAIDHVLEVEAMVFIEIQFGGGRGVVAISVDGEVEEMLMQADRPYVERHFHLCAGQRIRALVFGDTETTVTATVRP
jgi:hypothetical protein